MNEKDQAKLDLFYAEVKAKLPLARMALSVSALIKAAEAVLPIGDLDSITEHWSEELTTLEDVVKNAKSAWNIKDAKGG